MYENELYHHGRLGQKWGILNGPPYPLSETTFSSQSPKQELNDKVNVYKKGTIVGHVNEYNKNYPVYLYTNQKDRDFYKNRLNDKEEHIFQVRKDIKVPSNASQQIMELYRYTKDKDCLNDPWEYWKDNINQGGQIYEGFIKHMKIKGYDGFIDIRNYGMADDPILVFEPKKMLRELKTDSRRRIQNGKNKR
jgi:hypothetical protein